MPQFVPVVDVETPSNERNPNSREYAKHRRWEAPHNTSEKNKVNRGWEQGNVGWGVVGAFGSNEKDDGAYIRRSSSETQKMVKNEKGLWVRVKDSNLEDSNDGPLMSKGRGRGSGIPLTASIDDTRLGSSRYRSEEPDGKQHDHRSLSHRSRERNVEKSESQRKRDRSRSRSRSNSRARRRSPSDDSRHRYRDDHTESRKHSRHRSRIRSNSRRRHRRRSDSREREHRKPDISPDKDKERAIASLRDDEKVAEDTDADNFVIEITAVQVVNRLSEVFQQASTAPEKRLDMIMELFNDTAKISSLKSGKDLLVGREIIRTSYARATACAASVAKRIFVEPSAAGISYCFDIHRQGTSPGLGDRSKDAILLYKCNQARIEQVWGMTDTESLASSDIGKARLLESQAWKLALGIMSTEDSPAISEEMLHYHDYAKIETWG